MKKIKNLISWFSSLITKEEKVKYEDIEMEALLPKEAKKVGIHLSKSKKNNIKIKKINCNFKEESRFEIPIWNSEDINYFVANSELDRYSLNVGYNNENNYYNFNRDIKRLNLDHLDLFEEIEFNYFEELERYEKELEDILKFRYRTREEIGLEGELSVQSELMLLDENEYKVIHNVLIPSHNDATTQIDSIVISRYGIFVIETKKYSGIIVGDEDSKYWTSYYKKNKYSRKFKKEIITKKLYNPIRQNLGHILSLKKLLNGYENLKFHSIIAFDEIGDLKINTVTDVTYIKHIVKQINKYKQEVIDGKLVEELYYEILKHKLDDDISLQEHSEYLTDIKKSKIINYDNNIRIDYLLTLCITPRIGTKTIDLIKSMYNNDYDLDTIDDLLDILNRCYNVNSFITVPSKEILELYYKKALKFIDSYTEQGVLLTPYYDFNYPSNLIENDDYPQIIFSKGDIRILNNKKTGILVSRNPTKYGSSCAYRLGQICANKNITLVSIVGECYDLSAVKGSLDNGGKIILVNTTRLNLGKENINHEIYNKVLKNNGCIISFTNDKDFTSEYKNLRFNKTFTKIIDKLILVEPYLNDNIQKNIKITYTKEYQLAYVPQSESSKLLGNIDPDEIIMSKLNAIKLSDAESLERFLS